MLPAFLPAGAYPAFNLDCSNGSTALVELYECLRPKYSRLGVLGDAIGLRSDASKASLVLVGTRGSGTAWHRDATETYSIALGLDLPGSNQPAGDWEDQALALWLFIAPGREEEVGGWQVAYVPNNCK